MFGALSHLSFPLRAQPAKRVLVVNGHPDPGARRYCAALCAAYAEGAQSSGCLTQRVDVGAMTRRGVNWQRTEAGGLWEHLRSADRLLIAFPMWLGGPPPVLQLMLEEFAHWHELEVARLGEPAKDTHIIVTASLPGLVYRTNRGEPVGEWATSVPGRRIAQAVLIGSVETMTREDRCRWLSTIRRLGSSPLIPGKAVLACSR